MRLICLGGCQGPLLTAVNASYNNGVYVATACNITQAHTQARCFSAVGVGVLESWVIGLGGQNSAVSVATTSYTAPAITGFSYAKMDTVGGDLITVNGTNFVRHPCDGIMCERVVVVLRCRARLELQ